MKTIFPNVFLLCLVVKTFPVLFYIICGSAVERSFTHIISSRVSLCLMLELPILRPWASLTVLQLDLTKELLVPPLQPMQPFVRNAVHALLKP